MVYFILIVIAIIELVAIMYLVKRPDPIDRYREKIKELNGIIDDLEIQKKAMQTRRGELEHESRNNFDSDIGRDVAEDLRRSDD